MKIIKQKCVDSTMKMARRYLDDNKDVGLEEPVLFLADTQTEGQGQYDRTWVSDSEDGVYVTFLYKPKQFEYDQLEAYQSRLAMHVANLLSSISGVSTDIKAPNDVLINGKKVAGILVKSGVGSAQSLPSHVMIGIGINLNQDRFSPEISGLAISLSQASGVKYDKDDVISQLSDRLVLIASQK